MADANLTAERLRQVLDYDPEAGKFTWKIQSGNARPGGRAGCLRAYGYWGMKIDKRPHLAHRLAILWMTGDWPTEDVDHINGDRTDNRWKNLREVSRKVNLQNQRRARSDNAKGVLGVYQIKETGKWRARIQVDGRSVHIGCFDTSEEAHDAYVLKKRELHPGCTL